MESGDVLPEAPGAHAGVNEPALLQVAFTSGRRPEGSFHAEAFALAGAVLFQLGCGLLRPSSTPEASWEGGGIHQTSNKWSWVRTSHSPHIHNCGAHRSRWELRTSRCDLRWHFQPSPEMGGHQLYLFTPSRRLPIWCEQLCLAARFCLATGRVNLMK